MITTKQWKQAAGFLAIGLGLVAFTFVFYRYVYTHSKRLRVVAEGKVYRSGQMTEEGFRNAVATYGIRTIINLQQDNRDPDLPHNWFDRRTVKESELCKELGVRYLVVEPDLVNPDETGAKRPKAIDEFLALMDDESIYPVLIHCKAGLHRTGILLAVYRMEYEGWTVREAFEELKAHGFGKNCHCNNEYVRQYVLEFEKGKRLEPTTASTRKRTVPIE